MVPAVAVAGNPEVALLGGNGHHVNPRRRDEVHLHRVAHGKRLGAVVAKGHDAQHAHEERRDGKGSVLLIEIELVQGGVQLFHAELAPAAGVGRGQLDVVVARGCAGVVALRVGYLGQGGVEGLGEISVLRHLHGVRQAHAALLAKGSVVGGQHGLRPGEGQPLGAGKGHGLRGELRRVQVNLSVCVALQKHRVGVYVLVA